METTATIDKAGLTVRNKGGRPVGSRDRVVVPPRRLRGVLSDLLDRAEAGDAGAQATLTAAVLLADGRMRGASDVG